MATPPVAPTDRIGEGLWTSPQPPEDQDQKQYRQPLAYDHNTRFMLAHGSFLSTA